LQHFKLTDDPEVRRIIKETDNQIPPEIHEAIVKSLTEVPEVEEELGGSEYSYYSEEENPEDIGRGREFTRSFEEINSSEDGLRIKAVRTNLESDRSLNDRVAQSEEDEI